jgi:quinol-cytochrome oxidoreductase complex cytochrome b subunit
MTDRLTRVGLVAAMAITSLNVWTGAPLLGLWVGSRLAGDSGTSMLGVFAAVVVIFGGAILLTLLLARLGAVYDSVTGRPREVRRHVPWLRSMRGERPHDDAGEGPRLAPLDYILVGGVVICFLLFEFWFFFLSGSPIDQRSGRD